MYKNLKIFFVITIFILLHLILVIFFPIEQNKYSDAPASYATFFEYSIQHTIKTGYELSSKDIDENSLTPYTSGTLGSSHRILFDKFYSILLILFDKPPFTNKYIRNLIGVGLSIVFVGAILLISHDVSTITKINLDLNKYVIILAYSLFSSTIPIVYFKGGFTSNAVMGWIFILLSIHILLKKKEIKLQSLCILFLFILPPLYATPSLVYLIILTSIYVYQKFIIKREIIYSKLIILYVVYWFAYYLYIATDSFSTYVLSLSKVSKIFVEEARYILLDRYIIRGSEISQILNLINGVIVSIPVLYYLIYGNKFNENFPRIKYFSFGLIFSLIPLTLFFYLWAGLMGVFWRMQEWGGLISTIIFTIIIISVNKNHVKYIKIAAVCAIILGPVIVIYDSSDIAAFNKITQSENSGGLWLASHISDSDYVFTDHRLIAPFVLNDHFRVRGINDEDDPKIVKTSLEYIYYGNNSKLAYINLLKHYHSNYLFFSGQMTDKRPGIKGFDYFFKNASKRFLYKYDTYPKFNKIYNNEIATIYEVST